MSSELPYSELPPKCTTCHGLTMPLDTLWVCHTCRKNVGSRLPTRLQDPLGVVELGRQLLRDGIPLRVETDAILTERKP